MLVRLPFRFLDYSYMVILYMPPWRIGKFACGEIYVTTLDDNQFTDNVIQALMTSTHSLLPMGMLAELSTHC